MLDVETLPQVIHDLGCVMSDSQIRRYQLLFQDKVVREIFCW